MRFKVADIGHGFSGCQPFAGNKSETRLIRLALFCNASTEAGFDRGLFKHRHKSRCCISAGQFV